MRRAAKWLGQACAHFSLRPYWLRATKRPCIGVMWALTTNLGDDIQSIAQQEFIEVREPSKEIVHIERDQMGGYKGPPVKMLMSGWFMGDWRQFPPSARIKPVFISFHVSLSEEAEEAEQTKEVLKANLDYLKAHEPIGCRDDATRDLLRGFGVEAFTSGCMTLLLPPPPPGTARKGVYIVCEEEWEPDEWRDCVPRDVLARSEDLTHDLALRKRYEVITAGRRRAMARDVLDKYRTAELVITTRLHCALPCRAFGTPMIFLHTNYHTDKRFDGLRNILRGSADVFDFDKLRAPLNIDKEKELLRTKLLEKYAEADAAPRDLRKR